MWDGAGFEHSAFHLLAVHSHCTIKAGIYYKKCIVVDQNNKVKEERYLIRQVKTI